MEQIIGAVIFLIIIIAQIIKSIRESSLQQQPKANNGGDELILTNSSKSGKQQPTKQTKPTKQRPPERQVWRSELVRRDERSVFDVPRTESPRHSALVKELSPQGEGHRFAVDPGTFDTTNIVAPSIDPMVKPQLDSITGIYEQGVTFGETAKPAITLNLAEWLSKPEGICQAVIFAEIMNRPAWLETTK